VGAASAMMERQVGQLVRLVDDLLDVSRISRGKIELRRERIELTSAVHHAVEAARPLCERMDHELTVTLPPEPVYLNADPTRLAQIVGNLLTNACKFTERGGHIELVASGEWRVRRRRGDSTMTVQHYRELRVWQVSMSLAEQCYVVTKSFPKEELFDMTSQIRRAAAAVPANIAEGQGRQHTKEFLNHLSIARGSLMEVETHLLLSQRVGLLDQTTLDSLLTMSDEISRMLSGLRRALEAKL
ncbi:MAG: four helix bundle protein, partial [Gammaproteobacteria bacterium]